jgi:receptor protein-tyrosine kinase
MIMEMNEYETRGINLSVLLDDFLKEAKRIWYLIIVFAVVCAVGLSLFRYSRFVPYYEAHASFTVKVVNPMHAGISGYNTAAAEQMENTFPYIVNSDALRDKVMKYLGIGYVPGVHASVVPGSNIFTLVARDPNPQRAQDILEAVIVCYPEVADFVVGPTKMILLDESGVPQFPSNSFNVKDSLKTGAILGVALWFALTFLIALTKNTIHNEDELKRVLNVDCLGEIPTGKVSFRGTAPIITKSNDRSGFGESVRLLRMRVEKEMDEKNKKVLMISSAIPGEGKTTISTNLAISMALKGKKVLLVDCDMRNPSVGKALQIKSKAGLSDYLTDKAYVRDIIVATKIENLSIITGGSSVKTGYAELLANARLSQLIKAATKLFDYIILDTPPCSLLADASEVADVAEAALVVIRHDFASQEQIMDGVRGLADCGVPIMGCVLNGIEHGFATGYGYGYGYGHGYGYGYSYRHSYGYGNNK